MTIDTKAFWRRPVPGIVDDPRNFKWYEPEFYVRLTGQAQLVVGELAALLPKDASILELGCGAGRNLAALKQAGFINLSGVEINPDAIALGRKCLDLSGIAITCAAIEDIDIPTVDCVYTHGVLMHMPPASEVIFERIAKASKRVIMTVENEFSTGGLQWPRNYGQIFESFGWTQSHNYNTAGWPPNTKLVVLRMFTHE